jgi:hypothetical protein
VKLVFAIEPLSTVWDELVKNAWDHWQETQMHADGEPFNPLYERYARYGDSLVVFTARDDGALVGNCTMYLVQSMHTQRLKAMEDTWFLKPEYRKGRNAIEFYRYVEKEMIRRGATKCHMTAAPENGACRIMEYLGYKLDKYMYSKVL